MLRTALAFVLLCSAAPSQAAFDSLHPAPFVNCVKVNKDRARLEERADALLAGTTFVLISYSVAHDRVYLLRQRQEPERQFLAQTLEGIYAVFMRHCTYPPPLTVQVHPPAQGAGRSRAN